MTHKIPTFVHVCVCTQETIETSLKLIMQLDTRHNQTVERRYMYFKIRTKKMGLNKFLFFFPKNLMYCYFRIIILYVTVVRSKSDSNLHSTNYILFPW